MDGGNSDSMSESRTFLLLATGLALINHALAAFTCLYIPREPDSIARVAAGYAAGAFAISALGLIGVLRRLPSCLALFSRFLWLDAMVSSMARVVVLELLCSTFDAHGYCVDTVQQFWLTPSPHSYAAMNTNRWQDPLEQANKRCGMVVNTFHALCFLLVLSMSVAQGTVALAVRRYACHMEQVIGPEKRHSRDYEETWADEKSGLVLESPFAPPQS